MKTICDKCGAEIVDAVHYQDTDRQGNEHHLCNKCYDEGYRTCYECGEVIVDAFSDIHPDLDEYICAKCEDEKFEMCVACGSFVNPEKAHHHNNMTYCEECAHNHFKYKE